MTQPVEIVSFPVAGMTCASCVNRITRFLAKVEGVEEAHTSSRCPPARARSGRRVQPRPEGFPMHRSALALIAAAALLVAACSSAATPGSSVAASSAPSATRIEVTLTDGLRVEPAAMSVPTGVPVTFVVTNVGSTDHEFYLGDTDAQAEHEQEMATAGGMKHDEPEGIGVKPGETKELTYTFDTAGKALAGCHVAGHYGAGMKADITVEE